MREGGEGPRKAGERPHSAGEAFVVLVGRDLEQHAVGRLGVRSLRVRAYESRPPSQAHVAVLGLEALRSLVPAWMASLPERTSSRVCLMDARMRSWELMAWFQAGVDEVLDAQGLTRLLQQASEKRHVSTSSSRLSDVGWWAPICPDAEEGLRMLEAIDRLERKHSVADWADELDLSVKQLRDKCRNELRGTPREVIGAYLLAFHDSRPEGWTCEDVADALGYADAAALLHGLERARRRRRRR